MTEHPEPATSNPAEPDPVQLREVEARYRLETAALCQAGPSPWLAAHQAAGVWVYDLRGFRYMDFGPGGMISALGYYYSNPIYAMRDHLRGSLHFGDSADAAAAYPVMYAEALVGRVSLDREQVPQVMVCSGVLEAHHLLGRLTEGNAVRTAPLSAARRLDGGMVAELVAEARQAGKWVIADETETGFGRTGRLWGFDHYEGIRPDIVLTGPTGAAGLPYAAIVAPKELFEAHPEVGPDHLSVTACAAAYGVLAAMTDALFDNVNEMAGVLQTCLSEISAQFPGVFSEVSGVGLLRQLHLTDPGRTAEFRRACRDQGLLIGPDLTVTPPLTVCEDEITVAGDILAGVLLEWEGRDGV